MKNKSKVSPVTPAPAVGGTKAVDAVVQTKLEVAHSEMIKAKGRDIITKTGELAGKYLELCLYIRQHKVAPKLVSFELSALGFKRSRVSEINRVAAASEKLFSEYQAKLIGFDKCLELSRVEKAGEAATLTPAGKLLAETSVVTKDEVEAGVPLPEGGTSKERTGAEKMLAAAKVIGANATRPKEWTVGRWIVSVEKAPVTNPSLGS